MFGALRPIFGCLGNAAFFGSLLGRSRNNKKSLLGAFGADFSHRLVRNAAATQLQHGDSEAQGSLGSGQVSKKSKI